MQLHPPPPGWVDVDYADPDRTPAQPAPVDWTDQPDWYLAADEATVVQADGGVVAAVRRGLTTVHVGGGGVHRADFDTEGDAHADYARIRAEITGDPRHRLQAAGAWLAAARAEERQALRWLLDMLPGVVADGVPEAEAARLAGVDRMTVRRALGKR